MEISKEQKEAIEYLEKYTKWETYGERNLEKDIVTTLNLLEKLQEENRRLKTIRYSNEWGTESIHLITKNDLVEINTNKYMIEIENGKFVDLKQVYQGNKKYKQFFDLMLKIDSDYFMNCENEETHKLVDEILELESEETWKSYKN